jgi:hypothetical protein
VRYRVAYLRRPESCRLGRDAVGRFAGYATVIDFRADARRAPRAAFRQAGCSSALAEDRDLVLGIFMREHPRLTRFCGFPFFVVPPRLLPQPVDLFVIDLAGGAPGDLRELCLTPADLDVF